MGRKNSDSEGDCCPNVAHSSGSSIIVAQVLPSRVDPQKTASFVRLIT